MTDATLRIERLALRVRGMDEQGARQLAQALGPQLLRRLAPRAACGSAASVPRVDAGNVAFSGTEQTAAAIAAAIAARLPARERS